MTPQIRLVAVLLLWPSSACHDASGSAGKAPGARQVVAAKATGEPLMCREHGVPEALCTKCNPALVPVFKARGDWCSEHGFPESFCPICKPGATFPDVGTPEPAGSTKTGGSPALVRLRTPAIEAAAGIETVAARRAEAATFVDCTAKIAFHIDRVADVQAIVPGIIRRVLVELGASVVVGTPLFEIESLRVSEIQGELQTARGLVRAAVANVGRHRTLRVWGATSTRRLEVALQELASAKARVRVAEASLRMAGAVGSQPSGRYTLAAPLAGTVVRRPGVIGALAAAGRSLATVADTSVVQVRCQVPESAASQLALGQKMRVTVAGIDTGAVDGKITWIAAEVDPRTRTVTARADVPNPTGSLRANQFARARIETGAPASAILVPRVAIQRIDDTDVVFVRKSQGIYERRVVRRLGGGEMARVQGDVREGDAVVTTGAILLRTEMLPGSIGAGCCASDAPGGK